MKLELKNLAPYLPYGLKIEHPTMMSGNRKISEMRNLGQTSIEISHRIYVQITSCKPLLRPLSDLTKEIEIDGKKFVPMDELGKLFDMNVVEYCFISQNLDRHKLIQRSIGYSVAEKLFEWHIDVFGLIDQGLALPLI